MSLVYQTGIGIEEVADRINAALAAQETFWEQADRDRAAFRGVEYVRINLEPVSPDSFHIGNIPSLVKEEIPKDQYPYIAITPTDMVPDPADAENDHINVHRSGVGIHSVAKASPVEGPEFAFRRAARMAEAIYSVVVGDKDLKRMLQGLSNPLRAQLSETFVFQPGGHGDDWFWQAAGTQWAVKSYSVPPIEV
jgi:hypothetical protein